MASLIVSQLTSLDGFLAGPGGDLSGLPMGDAFDQHNLELLRRAGTLVFGRTTFGMFQGYWPQVEQDANAEPVQGEIASLVRSVGKLVVSDTLVLGADAPWRDAEVVPREASRARVAQLKADADRDLLIYGCTMVWQDLFAAGLVDELHLWWATSCWAPGCRCSRRALRSTCACSISAACRIRRSWPCATRCRRCRDRARHQ